MRITLRENTCCCGTDLRTGTIIIGMIDFLVALATIVVESIAAANTNYNWSDDSYWNDPFNELRPMYITMAVSSSILLIFACLLIFGVSKAKPKLILPWMYYAFISIPLSFICSMIYGVYSFNYSFESYGYLSIAWSFFCLGVKIYFVLVVWSHYHQLIGGTGTTLNNGVHVTMYPTVPIGQQPLPNSPQTYPNVQTQYPNVQMQYPNQPQPYLNIQVQQTFPNPQPPYPNAQPLPSIESMKRDI